MIIDDLIMALVQVMIAIATVLIELMVHLGALMFGASFMAARHTGLIRAGFVITALGAAYLLFGIIRWLVPALATPALTPLYSGPAFGVILILLLLGLFLFAIGAEYKAPETIDARPKASAAPGWLIHLFSYGFSFLLVLAVLSGTSSTAHNRSLTDLACDTARTKITADTETKLTEGLDLAGDLLGRDLTSNLPCQPPTE